MFPIFIPIFMLTSKSTGGPDIKDKRPFTKKVYKFLRKHPDKFFSASDIAKTFDTEIPTANGAMISLLKKGLVEVEKINERKHYKIKEI